ncbi:hypothetical protein KKC13_11310 [bacterium]|nr:hypothetical protein [bacterium]MBU1957756.1 hypothetical protein [bacterium]
MIENISLILTTSATIFAAIAAWCSYKVSKNSLDFQKKYAKNQNLINELNRIIYTAETLQILIPKPQELSDDEFESIEPLLIKLQSELERLNTREIIKYEDLKISLVKSKFDLVRDYSSLKEVINILEEKKSETFN